MSQSRGKDLKPPVDGMFYEIFGFGTFFRYHNSQNKIDAWESTVPESKLWTLKGQSSHPGSKEESIFIFQSPDVPSGEIGGLAKLHRGVCGV